MLAVDQDVIRSRKEQSEWEKHGVSTVRVDTMQEAIKKLTQDVYILICINADNVTYLPLLRIMRETTSTLIFIATSNVTTQDHADALYHGADAYGPFQDTPEKNIQSALAMIHNISERRSAAKKPVQVITCLGLLLYPKYRQVFCHDAEIELTRTEHELLYYLASNSGQTLLYKQLYRKVWNADYDRSCHQILSQHIFRLRKKLKAGGFGGSIESVHGTGCRLPAKGQDTTNHG
jgi:two-component system response regulator ArlR